MLLHLSVLAGVSFAGLHVHHHGASPDLHVAAGLHCSAACHESCDTESTADHLFEILGSAANVVSPGKYHAQLAAQLRSERLNFTGFGPARAALAPPGSQTAPGFDRVSIESRSASLFELLGSIGRASVPRAPPFFAS